MKAVLLPATLAVMLAPAVQAQEYVNIGEYKDGLIETVAPPPATYEIITLPAPVGTETVIYTDPPAYTDVSITTRPIEIVPYQPPLGAQGSIEAGMTDREYESARLAAYDTNRDGRITTAEAIATLRPLTKQ